MPYRTSYLISRPYFHIISQSSSRLKISSFLSVMRRREISRRWLNFRYIWNRREAQRYKDVAQFHDRISEARNIRHGWHRRRMKIVSSMLFFGANQGIYCDIVAEICAPGHCANAVEMSMALCRLARLQRNIVSWRAYKYFTRGMTLLLHSTTKAASASSMSALMSAAIL